MKQIQKKTVQEKPIEPQRIYTCLYCLKQFQGPARAWYMVYCSHSHRQMAYRRRKKYVAMEAGAGIGQGEKPVPA